jgi:hypothetical protein
MPILAPTMWLFQSACSPCVTNQVTSAFCRTIRAMYIFEWESADIVFRLIRLSAVKSHFVKLTLLSELEDKRQDLPESSQ